MLGNKKNGKLIGSFGLLLLLCLALLFQDKRSVSEMPALLPTATPTPELSYVLSNIWLVEGKDTKIEVLYDGELHSFRLAAALGTALKECIVDVTVERDVVTELVVKQDTIEAKVLRIGEDYIELEGYGILPLEEESRVYRIYDGTEEVSWQEVSVGYTTSSFVLSGNRVCAALVEKPVKVTSIRVLIQTSSYGGYYHDSLECGSETAFYLSDGAGKTKWMEAGEKVMLTPELVEEYGGRIYLGTEKEEGKLALYNVRRAVGVPSYRGTLEVALQDGKMLVVNELSLEEYLYGVLPSEMPESFGMEALKAQAVCARSYACNQLLANRYLAFGAHVDDSMNCQVYQNYGETESAIEAVKTTFGRVLAQEGSCISAYYFSCSYGYTSDSLDIWGESAGTRLSGVVQAAEGTKKNLSRTENFEKFLDSSLEWYDKESVWFRWNTVVGTELSEKILKRLKERQEAVPDMILVKVAESGETMQFAEGKIEKFGKLEDIIIAERGSSGVITKLILVGSEASYLVQREYNIRYILAPLNVVYLQDGSTSSNMNLLPSAYFTVEKKENYFVIRGGGYGHGTGMSQYGAKYLAAHGMGFEEILMHYYKNTDVGYLYSQK